MQNAPLAQTNGTLKRNPGGQRGNQNARKHGFYSRALSPEEIGEFWRIVNLEGLDPEIALVRLKLKSVLQRDPGNRRALGRASALLAKWLGAKYSVHPSQRNYLRALIRGILEQFPGALPSHPAGTVDSAAVLTKRLEPLLGIESSAVAPPALEKAPSESQKNARLQNENGSVPSTPFSVESKCR